MPDTQRIGLVEDQDRNRAERRKKIADQHRFLLIEFVGNRARKYAHKNIRRICTYPESRSAERRSGLLIQPQRQRKCRNLASQLRQALRAPEQVKIS